MKIILMSLILAAGSAGFASESYVAGQHTCSELNELLQQNGTITLKNRFGSSIYVANGSSCGIYEQPVSSYEASQDNQLCFVGYWCKKIEGY